MLKMEQINREYLARLSNDALYDLCVQWVSHTIVERSAIIERGGDADALMSVSDLSNFARILTTNKSYLLAAMGIERHTDKDPKRYVRICDVYDQIKCFDDEIFAELPYPALTVSLESRDIKTFLTEYALVLDLNKSVVEWFDHLKAFWSGLGYASNNAQFKEWWYKGKVWDLAMILRVVLCKAEKTPDLYSVMKVMWQTRVLARFEQFLTSL